MLSKKKLFVAIAVSIVVIAFAYLNFGKSSRVVESWSDSWVASQDGFMSKNFFVQESWKGKIVEVGFGKLSGNYEIRVNGILIKNGEAEYEIFVDISPYLKFDTQNTIEVKASQNSDLGYVILTAKNPISIVRNGIKVEQILNDKISVRAEIRNATGIREKVDVYFVLKNGDGKVVAKKDITLPLLPKSVSSCSVVLPSDKLGMPHTSRAEVSIVQLYKVLDSDSFTF